MTTNQEAIIRLFRVMNRYVGNLAPMPGVFSDYPASVVRHFSVMVRYPSWVRNVVKSGHRRDASLSRARPR
jgi:hypothetical protein